MPLLYRVLMRLAVLALVLGVLAGMVLILGSGMADNARVWIIVPLVGVVPAALIAAIAWVVRPPLDADTLRRLWRE